MIELVKVNEEISEDKWRSFSAKNRYSSPFQSPEGLKFFQSLESMEANVHAIMNGDDIVSLAVVTIQNEKGLKKHLSRRAIIYAGPLLTDSISTVTLLEHLAEFYKKSAIYIETRNFFDYSYYKDQFAQQKWEYIPWLNFHLRTDEEGPMRKRMSSSRLRQVKKGIKNGAQWREASNEDEIKEFYLILKNLYKGKIKKPLPQWDFFRNFYSSSMGKYLLVEFEGKIIGGIMCPIAEDKAIYEFYIAGKDQEFKNQYPSVLATYAAMDYGVKNNLNYFDFMGAGSVDEEYGVRDFKARFGGGEVENGRFRVILDKARFKLGETGLKILSKIK